MNCTRVSGPWILGQLNPPSSCGNTYQFAILMRGNPPYSGLVNPVFRPYADAGVLWSAVKVGWYRRLYPKRASFTSREFGNQVQFAPTTWARVWIRVSHCGCTCCASATVPELLPKK